VVTQHAPDAGYLKRPGMHVDRIFGLGWIVLGLGIIVESWRMDRLEQQHINPWTVPGLLPGMLGVTLAIFGLVLLLRPAAVMPDEPPLDRRRAGLATLLCLGFAGGLVGSGLPFWLAVVIFVFAAIAIFEWQDWAAAGTLAASALRALLIAACTAAAVTVIFQEVFLVRLP
jgi:hypothetical protein